MKRNIILFLFFFSCLCTWSQMNIWRNGIISNVYPLADIDSITFMVIPKDPAWEGMSDSWIEVNQAIRLKWSTTTTIPEPKGEYEIIENQFIEEPTSTWKHGCFKISLSNLEAVKTYPDVLREAGWQSTINGGNVWWSDMYDYMCYVYYDETSGMIMQIYFYYRPDTGLMPGEW